MEDIEKRLQQIRIENFIWIVYFFIIALCLYGNYFEKEYFLTGNQINKETYRKITILIFCVAIIFYIYFVADNWKEYQSLNSCDSKEKIKYTQLNLIGSTLILISGLIFLYIACSDTELVTEIAFN